MGDIYGGAGKVSYAVPASPGSASYQVECVADASGAVTVTVAGDVALSGASMTCEEGSNGGRLLSFLAGDSAPFSRLPWLRAGGGSHDRDSARCGCVGPSRTVVVLRCAPGAGHSGCGGLLPDIQSAEEDVSHELQ